MIRNLGNDPVGQMPAVQSQGPDFRFPPAMKKPGTAAHLCKPDVERVVGPDGPPE